MIKTLIQEFPVTTVTKKPAYNSYTREEVDVLIDAAVERAVAEARRIDEESMAKHNRDATIISMILGFTALALFVDGLLRILGIIPPFMDIDVNVIDKIAERVENDMLPLIQDTVKKMPTVPKPWLN